MPPKLTYQLLRLIVLCAFALGVIGVTGWIWLQSISQAQARARVQVDDSISNVLRTTLMLSGYQSSYALPSVERVVERGDKEIWLLAQHELKRTWSYIENAKTAIVRYNAVAPKPIDLTKINTLLIDRQELIAKYVLGPPTDMPSVEEVKKLYQSYGRLVRELVVAVGKLDVPNLKASDVKLPPGLPE